MFKWIAAFVLSFAFPPVGIPWMLYLFHTSKQNARKQQLKKAVSRTLGSEKPEDFSSQEEFDKEINQQVDNLEGYWRQGHLSKVSDFDPSFVPLNGINWSRKIYTNKCRKVGRNPIPELLEDFDHNETVASEALDLSVDFLSGIMSKTKDSIIKRLKSGEDRLSILKDYNHDLASSENQMVNVHCENRVWKISIVKSLQLLHGDKRRLLTARLKESPETFSLSFSNTSGETGEEK